MLREAPPLHYYSLLTAGENKGGREGGGHAYRETHSPQVGIQVLEFTDKTFSQKVQLLG